LASLLQTPVPELFVADLPEDLVHTVEEGIQESEEEIHTWTSRGLHRQTLEFGKSFSALERGEVIEKPLPEYLETVRKHLFTLFQVQLGLRDVNDLDNTIVSIYKKGDGIPAHIDRANQPARDGRERNYYFGDCILGYIVRPDTRESLYFV